MTVTQSTYFIDKYKLIPFCCLSCCLLCNLIVSPRRITHTHTSTSTMASDLFFTDDELAIDEGLGYPKAYSKLCRDRSFCPFSHGPPFTFIPYALPQIEGTRAKELDEIFPVINPKAKPTTKPKIFVSLLWKQLNHLGNAGFDPEIFRVDPYGNVLHYHADPASPLAWDIDHWFPCSRGGLTVASNLRILQWQVCRKKHDQLEYLIPWWDLQVGISINQFLSIFASPNSDFRHRAFSWLFSEGESEEINASQTVDSHAFPQHFNETKQKVGLAPAAVVLSRREHYDGSSAALKSLDFNRRPRSSTPIIAAKKLTPSLKENEDPNMVSNPYEAIVLARDSLRQREETAKMQAEIQKLDDEVNELKRKTEDEKVNIQELELVLIKRRRRAEKCRRLAEAQSSYRAMLEKMIRDAMHQSVVYKEQVRLNQAASNALMARLEAQKAICDSSERELHMKFKQRDELEKQIRPEWEQARKRSRADYSLDEEKDDKIVLYSPGNNPETELEVKANDNSASDNLGKNVLYLTADEPKTEIHDRTSLYLPGIEHKAHSHKELRVFLEEEQKASEAGPYLNEEEGKEELEERCKVSITRIGREKPERSENAIVAAEDEKPIKERPQKNLEIREGGKIYNIQFPVLRESENEEDEESRQQRGKGNVEKWLQMLLENSDDVVANPQNADDKETRTDEIIRKLNLAYPQRDMKSRAQESQEPESVTEVQKGNNQQLVPEKEHIEKEEIVIMKAARNSTSSSLQKEGWQKREIVQMKDVHTPLKNPQYRVRVEKSKSNEVDSVLKEAESTDVCEEKEIKEKSGKERELARSESARLFRRIPSSPSLILSGMKKRVDCMGKKPLVMGDDDGNKDRAAAGNSFIKSSIKTIKRAVKL